MCVCVCWEQTAKRSLFILWNGAAPSEQAASSLLRGLVPTALRYLRFSLATCVTGDTRPQQGHAPAGEPGHEVACASQEAPLANKHKFTSATAQDVRSIRKVVVVFREAERLRFSDVAAHPTTTTRTH